MNIDHIGVVVKSIDEGIRQWSEMFGYSQKTEVVVNSRQKVKVVFMQKNDSIMVKLIEPTDVNSSVYNFAIKGGGLHHLCFKCSNLQESISNLKEYGAILLVKPQPGEAFGNEDIAFVLARNNLNIELIETDKKAKVIL